MNKIMSRSHYVYMTTNYYYGAIYIGKRSCYGDPKDDYEYMGSGKRLKKMIEECGIDNFEKEILHICDSEDEAYAVEAKYLTKDFVSSNLTYNLLQGNSNRKKDYDEYLSEKYKLINIDISPDAMLHRIDVIEQLLGLSGFEF